MNDKANPMLMQTPGHAPRFAAHITIATGVTDPDDIAAIEDVMSDFHRTSDALTRAQLRASALKAWEIVRAIRSDPDMIAELERLMGGR